MEAEKQEFAANKLKESKKRILDEEIRNRVLEIIKEQTRKAIFDEFNHIQLTALASNYVAHKLKENGVLAGAFSVGESTAYNIVFIDLEKHKIETSVWAGGRGNLFVAIEGVGCFSFNMVKGREFHPNYLSEKMNHNFGVEVGKNIANFISNVFEHLVAIKQQKLSPDKNLTKLKKCDKIKI